VQGPQTAIVVGPPGEDIWTDKYGRVKVRFHWDRGEAADEGRSCWVRVASFWAGKHWGALHLPRPGHEVVVAFLEGNPDRPLITGSVYNDANRPAWSLPDQRNISGIRSRSTPDGTAETYNEIILDDTRHKERVAIHAERNFHLRTEATENRLIGANSETRIRGARGVIVQGEQQITFEDVSEGGEAAQFQDTIGDYLEVHGNRFVVVGRIERQQAGEGHGIEVLQGDQVILLHVGSQSIVITDAGDQRIQLENGDQIIEVAKGSQQILVQNGNHVVNASSVTMEAKRTGLGSGILSLTAGANAYLNAEKNVTIEAKEKITFKVGQTTLEMSEKGVEIAAPFIVQRALVKAQTLASIVDIGATLQVNVNASVMTSITSNGMVNVAGGGVLIN
jgi:type VI secretion system secreted protein VgrG